MSKSQSETREGLQAFMARDHEELDRLFEALLAALQADARGDARRLWATFEDGLCRHMELEEAQLLPLMHERDPREVDALLREHDEIRAMLAELGVGVDLHEIRVQTVSDFIDQLRRHAIREDAIAYRWAQENVPAARQEAVRSALGAAPMLRQRLRGLASWLRESASIGWRTTSDRTSNEGVAGAERSSPAQPLLGSSTCKR